MHNPSNIRGGTLRFANSGDWDSLDPADTYLVPGVWSTVQLYCPPNLSNAYITNGFQMYDYISLGTTRR